VLLLRGCPGLSHNLLLHAFGILARFFEHLPHLVGGAGQFAFVLGKHVDPARMPLIFLTLRRHLEWWTAVRTPTKPLSPGEPGAKGRTCTAPKVRSTRRTRPRNAHAARASSGQSAHSARVSFTGSGIVFEYYPGMGLRSRSADVASTR
jgi:hypothetical protein